MSKVVASANVSAVSRPQVATRRAAVRCDTVTPVARVKQAGVALLGAALLATAAPAFADDILELGEDVFSGNCAACHVGGENSVEPTRTLKKDAITQYLQGGYNEGAIEYQVRNGKNAMPAWEGRLDDEEIKAVVKYVFTQAEAGWQGAN